MSCEEVKEMTKIEDEKNVSSKRRIKEFLNSCFEMAISFCPVIFYWLIFYLSDKPVDWYEHIKNGSITWIFLTFLVMGNFKIVTNKGQKEGFFKGFILAMIILLIIFSLALYLILNFSDYKIMDINLDVRKVTALVIALSGCTLMINILRIAFL